MSATENSRLVELESLRDTLKAAIQNAESPREIAMVSKELRACLLDIEKIPVTRSSSPADELARKRKERARAS